MEQQYGDDFISITDEDGKEYELEVLAELEHNGSRYLALVPAGSGDDDEEEDLEVSILKSVEENGEEFLEAIEDDAELEEVYQRADGSHLRGRRRTGSIIRRAAANYKYNRKRVSLRGA